MDDRPVKDVGSFKEAAKAGDPEAGDRRVIWNVPAGKSFVVIKGD